MPTIVESNIVNVESQIETQEVVVGIANTTLDIPISGLAEAPKAPKKRAPKKKAEVAIPTIVESNIVNIESQVESEPESQDVDGVVVDTNVDSQMDDIQASFSGMNVRSPERGTSVGLRGITGDGLPSKVIIDSADDSTSWVDQQYRNIQTHREPILNTFAEVSSELTEEVYQAIQNHKDIPNNLRGQPLECAAGYSSNTSRFASGVLHKIQISNDIEPIDNIVSSTLENDNIDDDYTEQIMLESFTFADQKYMIDPDNRIFDYNTLLHIGQYDDNKCVIHLF